jgi:hypothetical protein
MSPAEPIPGGCRTPSGRRKSAWNWSQIPASICFQVDELLQRSIGLALLTLQGFRADFPSVKGAQAWKPNPKAFSIQNFRPD